MVDAVVRDGDVHVTGDHYRARRQLAAKKWGDGCALTIRIEPEEEAWRYADAKHYYGHLVTPVAEFTGETKHDVHLRLKALYLPDGKTSITELDREEFKAFLEAVEQGIREDLPEAWGDCVERMSLYQQRRSA